MPIKYSYYGTPRYSNYARQRTQGGLAVAGNIWNKQAQQRAYEQQQQLQQQQQQWEQQDRYDTRQNAQQDEYAQGVNTSITQAHQWSVANEGRLTPEGRKAAYQLKAELATINGLPDEKNRMDGKVEWLRKYHDARLQDQVRPEPTPDELFDSASVMRDGTRYGFDMRNGKPSLKVLTPAPETQAEQTPVERRAAAKAKQDAYDRAMTIATTRNTKKDKEGNPLPATHAETLATMQELEGGLTSEPTSPAGPNAQWGAGPGDARAVPPPAAPQPQQPMDMSLLSADEYRDITALPAGQQRGYYDNRMQRHGQTREDRTAASAGTEPFNLDNLSATDKAIAEEIIAAARAGDTEAQQWCQKRGVRWNV